MTARDELDERRRAAFGPRRPHKPGDPDTTPVRDRPVSSVSVLAHRVRQVSRALHVGDETAARFELRALASEALLLSRQHPLRLSPLDQRTRIAVERDPTGRGAS
jgi:hypothetical protein